MLACEENSAYVVSFLFFFSSVFGCDVPLMAMLILCGILGLVRAGTHGKAINMILIEELTKERYPSVLSMKVLFKFVVFSLGPITGERLTLPSHLSQVLLFFVYIDGMYIIYVLWAGYLADLAGTSVYTFFLLASLVMISATLTIFVRIPRQESCQSTSDRSSC